MKINANNKNNGDGNSGYYNSGVCNSGNYNSGDYNSGIFNTDERKMRAFNKLSGYTYREFRKKWGYQDINISFTLWVSKKDMTDKEKKEVSGWKTKGGYLKTLSYKEAWKVAWNKATQKQKDWYMSLPNFDKDIWFEITGIDLGASKRKKELLDKAQELQDKAQELQNKAQELQNKAQKLQNKAAEMDKIM